MILWARTMVANASSSNDRSWQSLKTACRPSKLKDQTKDISIDPNSIEIDIDNFSISYKLGGEKIKVISLIYDNAGQLETRLISVKNQNPTLEVLEKGKSGNVDWAVSVIKADEILKEEALPKKLKTDIEIEYHKNLNPKFWLNNHLKSNIRKNLLSLAKYYFKTLELEPNVKIKDIIFTGSYNLLFITW
jgi:hypothetical protein